MFSVGYRFVFRSPAADAGAVGLEVQAAVEFAGDGAVGTGRSDGEKSGGQSDGLGGPPGLMCATGPAVCQASGGAQVTSPQIPILRSSGASFKVSRR